MPASPLAQHLIGLIYAVDPTIWARRADLCLLGGDPVLLARRLGRIAAGCDFRTRTRVAVIDNGVFSGAPLAALSDEAILSDMIAAGELPAGSGRHSGQADGVIDRLIAHDASRVVSSGMDILWISGGVQGGRDHERSEIVLRLCDETGGKAGPRAAEGPARTLFDESCLVSSRGLGVLKRALAPVLRHAPAGKRFADIVVTPHLEVMSGFVSPGYHPEAVRFDARFMEEIGAEVFRLARRVPTSVEDAIADWRADIRRAAGLVAG